MFYSFSFRNFRVPHFTFKSVPFELAFVEGRQVCVYIFFPACGWSAVSVPFVDETIFAPLCSVCSSSQIG